jgi:hypothetical protein
LNNIAITHRFHIRLLHHNVVNKIHELDDLLSLPPRAATPVHVLCVFQIGGSPFVACIKPRSTQRCTTQSQHHVQSGHHCFSQRRPQLPARHRPSRVLWRHWCSPPEAWRAERHRQLSPLGSARWCTMMQTAAAFQKLLVISIRPYNCYSNNVHCAPSH